MAKGVRRKALGYKDLCHGFVHTIVRTIRQAPERCPGAPHAAPRKVWRAQNARAEFMAPQALGA